MRGTFINIQTQRRGHLLIYNTGEGHLLMFNIQTGTFITSSINVPVLYIQTTQNIKKTKTKYYPQQDSNLRPLVCHQRSISELCGWS